MTGARMMDNNSPVVILSCRAQQMTTHRDALGAIMDGVDEQLETYIYVLSFRRDPNELDPARAWQLLDLGVFLMDDL